MPGKRENYLSWSEYSMGIALLASLRSKDPSTQVVLRRGLRWVCISHAAYA